jgi:hypothetical protein
MRFTLSISRSHSTGVQRDLKIKGHLGALNPTSHLRQCPCRPSADGHAILADASHNIGGKRLATDDGIIQRFAAMLSVTPVPSRAGIRRLPSSV